MIKLIPVVILKSSTFSVCFNHSHLKPNTVPLMCHCGTQLFSLCEPKKKEAIIGKIKVFFLSIQHQAGCTWRGIILRISWKSWPSCCWEFHSVLVHILSFQCKNLILKHMKLRQKQAICHIQEMWNDVTW